MAKFHFLGQVQLIGGEVPGASPWEGFWGSLGPQQKREQWLIGSAGQEQGIGEL